MNILIFSWRGPNHPHSGGAELVTHEHAKFWIKNGHKVTLFTSSFEKAKENETVDGVSVIRKGNQAFGVHLHALLWYLFQRKDKYDLVIDHFHGIPFFTPIYIRNVKKIAFIHEVAGKVWSHNPWKGVFHFLPSIVGRVGEPFIFKLFYRSLPFLTVSSSTKKDLMLNGISEKNITVIENGVSIINTQVPKNKKFTVIFLGALAKDKGIEDAIYAFSEVNKAISDCLFWIVGKGLPDYVTELSKLITKLGIEKSAVVWGYVSDKKKFELLKRSHVLINSSLHEGWGLVNIEANSQGLPVVGYKVNGVVDSVVDGDTGLLTTEGNIHGLSQNIKKLFNDNDKYKKISKQAVAWSRKYTWEASTKKSLKYIESI